MQLMAAGRALPVARMTVTPLASAALSASTVDGSTCTATHACPPCTEETVWHDIHPFVSTALGASTIDGSTRSANDACPPLTEDTVWPSQLLVPSSKQAIRSSDALSNFAAAEADALGTSED